MNPPVGRESNMVEPTAPAESLVCQRAAFDLPAGLHYLNCAYLGPLPRTVAAAGVAAISRKLNPSTIAPADFFAEAEDARRLFARLVQAPDASRIAIIPAVSYGVATVVRNTSLSHGQNIVVAGEDFPSDVYAWRRRALREGAELRMISAPQTSADRAARWNERLLDSVDGSTAVVAVPQVHWADGTRFDLASIGARARQVGAAFVVDGTQSVGALAFDVREIQPDALICAGYKWLLGPYAIGAAYFGPRYDAGVPLEENWISRRGSEDFQRLVDYEDRYADGAVRYDAGERGNFILLPMFVESLRRVLEWTPESIQQYCRGLTAPRLERARELGFGVENESWRGAHLFGLRTPPGIDLKALQNILQREKVVVSLRGAALRVSPNIYNDEGDLDALIQVLRSVVEAS